MQGNRVLDASRLCPLEEYLAVIPKELGIRGERLAVLCDELWGKFHLGQVLGAQVGNELFATLLVYRLQARDGLMQCQDGLGIIQVKGGLEGSQEASWYNLSGFSAKLLIIDPMSHVPPYTHTHTQNNNK